MRSILSRRAFAVASTTGAFAVSISARAAQFSWKFGTTVTADGTSTVAVTQALAKIRHDTNGGLDIRSFANSTLGNDGAMIEQLRLGALETMIENGGTLDSVVPLASIEGVAFAFPDQRTVLAAMNGEVGKLVRNEFSQYGFIGFERIFENGFRYFTSNAKPIRTAADLQGLKFRVSPGKLYLDTFRSLGVSTTTINMNELYVSLQTHLADAQETPLQTIETRRFYEVQKYCSLSRHMWSGFWFLVNRSKWESLPRNYQEIMRKHINDAADQQVRTNRVVDVAMENKLQRQGLAFNPIDAGSFKAKLLASGYYGRWREAYGTAAWTALEKYSGPLG